MFNVRVYGFLVVNDMLLLSTEQIQGNWYTKLPGGGLEFGEGTIDCLKREFIEECNLKVDVQKHIYTTDFFQPSAFHAKQQIISIYYQVACASIMHYSQQELLLLAEQLPQEVHQNQQFKWMNMHDISASHFSLPIDKIAIAHFKASYGN